MKVHLNTEVNQVNINKVTQQQIKKSSILPQDKVTLRKNQKY